MINNNNIIIIINKTNNNINNSNKIVKNTININYNISNINKNINIVNNIYIFTNVIINELIWISLTRHNIINNSSFIYKYNVEVLFTDIVL